MTAIYKLTDRSQQTYGGFQWILNEWREASGEGGLCGPGWLHCYSDPLLAVLLNPIHANITNPLLFEAEAEGSFLDDHGLKQGWTRMRLTTELPLPEISTEQRVRFAILCAKETINDPRWNAWADGWLSGEDRSESAAFRAYSDAYAASTAFAAATAAAHAAADASVPAAAHAAAAAASAAAAAAIAGMPMDLISLAKKAVGGTP